MNFALNHQDIFRQKFVERDGAKEDQANLKIYLQ